MAVELRPVCCNQVGSRFEAGSLPAATPPKPHINRAFLEINFELRPANVHFVSINGNDERAKFMLGCLFEVASYNALGVVRPGPMPASGVWPRKGVLSYANMRGTMAW